MSASTAAAAAAAKKKSDGAEPLDAAPANGGEVADEAYIDVVLPGTAAPAASTTVLHDFSTCTTKFSGLLQGGGMVFAVNSATPTLTVNSGGGGLLGGGGLQEFVATRLFLVPKLHASNQLTQVSASDMEIVLEHGLSSGGGGKAARYFLCAVVSADPAIPDDATAAAPKLIGSDPALLAFLRNIDTSVGASAQLRANNAKRLPLDTPLRFPGIGTCMAYPDRQGNTVLLTSAPLLASPALVARLYALTSASAPVFSNFDLAQAEGSSVSLLTFRANRGAASSGEEEDPLVALSDPLAPAAAPDGGGGGGGEGFATPTVRRQGETDDRDAKDAGAGGGLTAKQTLALVALFTAGALAALPVWLYGPRMYVHAVLSSAGARPPVGFASGAGVNSGILATKGMIAAGYVLVAVLVGVGAGAGMYAMLIAGTLLALVLTTFVASVYFDLTASGSSIVQSLPHVNRTAMLDVFRYDYSAAAAVPA